MQRIQIERAGKKDVPAVAALAARMWDASEEDLAEEFASLADNPETTVFVARLDGQTVAFAQCQLRHDYVEGTKTSPVGYLEGVFTAEPQRRKGLAAALLAACEDWARDCGCTEFASDCELGNTESQEFHQAVGFEEASRLVAYVRKI
jgi:aminoglycoside 6'-N-acetyltransferase I